MTPQPPQGESLTHLIFQLKLSFLCDLCAFFATFVVKGFQKIINYLITFSGSSDSSVLSSFAN